jgi:hydroxymethylpyrimidine/phosphomethylpyrimidine kinase
MELLTPVYPKGVIAVALSIAGSDPSGGAGIQADLKTFHQFGVYGEAVVTLLTVQNTQRVWRVDCLDPSFVAEQLRAVIEDIPPGAAKTGALGNAAIVEAVAAEAKRFPFPLVVDPVMVSKHGARLLSEDAMRAVREKLLPLAVLVTPNLPEAEFLAGAKIATLAQAREAARRILGFGVGAVLIKGGHFSDTATDILFTGGRWHDYPAEHIETPHTHGTGCTYSAAITAEVARGKDLPDAVRAAKTFIDEAIRTNPGLGRGAGPVNHFAAVTRPPQEKQR